MAKAKKTVRPALTFEDFVKRPPKLTILTDQPLVPAEAFDADTFNFRYKLGPLFDILRHPRTKTPMAILISGDWGTGKTSAMKWLEGLLQKWNETGPTGRINVRPVWFYPWKYDNKEDVRRGLIAEVIIKSIDVENISTRTVISAAKKFGMFLGKSFIHALASIKLKGQVSAGAGVTKVEAGAEVDLASIKEILSEYQQAVHPEKAFLNEFETTLKDWVQDIVGKDGKERMVIFIDDLDRCMPEIGLQVLEALKLYLNIPNLIFVLGVDKKVVEKLVVEHYRKLGLVRVEEKNKAETEEKLQSEQDKACCKQDEEKAKQYLSKMFQVEVEFEPTEQQISDFFEKQLTDIPYWTDGLSDSEQELFRDLVLKSVGRNPREVKRLINSALIKGASSVLIKKDGIKFNQGLQLFFVRKILDERYTMASEAGSKRGIEFFVEWSRIVRKGREKNQDFPLTITVPADFGREPQKELDIEEKTRMRLDNLFASFAPDEYHDFLKNPKFSGLLHLLADEDLGRLMQIPYPAEAAEIADVIGTSKDVDIMREAVARHLGKKPDELTDDDYRKITELNLSGSGITDISALKRFPDLQKLFLGGTQISDIGVLKDLTNLKWLSLRETQVSDIDVLAGLTMLQDLNLFGTKVNDIGVLSGLTSLQVLSLAGTQVNDISVLSSLTNLQTLVLSRMQVSEIGALSMLTKLQALDLSGTPVIDIGSLSGLTNLQGLNLSSTKVSDISALSGLTNLQELNLSETKVSDIGSLSGLTNLLKLNLFNTQVSDIGDLSGLTNLRWLELRNTLVSDIGALSGLTKLQWLYLSDTNVSDIGALSDLTNLQSLELSGTKVSDEQVAELKKKLPKLRIYR